MDKPPLASRLIIILALTAAAVAQTPADSTAPKKFSIVPVPFVAYAPETRWSGGVFAGMVYHLEGVERPSSCGISAMYSERKQFVANAEPSVYVGSWHFTHESEWKKWPDSYWGVGPHTPDEAEEAFTARIFRTETGASKELWPRVWVGMHYQYESVQLVEFEPGGWFEAMKNSGGRSSGRISGAGGGIGYDTRDNVFFPSRGLNCEAGVTRFDPLLGSQFAYTEYSFNLRRYLSLHGSHVLALQGYGQFIDGLPNFLGYSSFGADDKLRGYSGNRYKDKHTVYAQAEYRFPIWWRFRGALFTGAGDVAPDVTAFAPRKFKHVIGGGLRIVAVRSEKLSLRMDLGYGAGSDGFYLSVNEAF